MSNDLPQFWKLKIAKTASESVVCMLKIAKSYYDDKRKPLHITCPKDIGYCFGQFKQWQTTSCPQVEMVGEIDGMLVPIALSVSFCLRAGE